MQEEFVETTGAEFALESNWFYDGPSGQSWFISWDELPEPL